MRIPPNAELDAVDPPEPGRAQPTPPTPGEQLELYLRNLAYGDEKDSHGRPANPAD